LEDTRDEFAALVGLKSFVINARVPSLGWESPYISHP